MLLRARGGRCRPAGGQDPKGRAYGMDARRIATAAPSGPGGPGVERRHEAKTGRGTTLLCRRPCPETSLRAARAVGDPTCAAITSRGLHCSNGAASRVGPVAAFLVVTIDKGGQSPTSGAHSDVVDLQQILGAGAKRGRSVDLHPATAFARDPTGGAPLPLGSRSTPFDALCAHCRASDGERNQPDDDRSATRARIHQRQ